MRRILLESPFAGDTPANLTYVRRAMADALSRGEAPFASHALYTQPGVLDDTIPSERERGMAAGFAWGDVAHAVVLYMDRGMSGGMKAGLERALALGVYVECRWLDSDPCGACVGGEDDPHGFCTHCEGKGRVAKVSP